MRLHQPAATIFVPDGTPVDRALARVTHLGVGAHQDDLEIMAFHGIAACFGLPDAWFAGVTCTNGGGSPRAGIYAHHTDEQMQGVRRREQDKAAALGEYAAMIQLGYPSGALKTPGEPDVRADLDAILAAARPSVVYTHNLADKHETHVGVAIALIEALRALPPDRRPERLYGCEVWRDLDWLPDDEKVPLDVGRQDHVAAALLGIYDSQIAGGKRYDLATMGRRRANATYFESHGVDVSEEMTFAMDLTPLVRDDTADPVAFVTAAIERFRDGVRRTLEKRLGR
ncbi:MAG: PIG-L family deacetylase [Planctomycetes bacterium]|nr:PIG-L family deacetylase [Planctomycetota bacterium]